MSEPGARTGETPDREASESSSAQPTELFTIHGDAIMGPTGRPKHEFADPAPLSSHGPPE